MQRPANLFHQSEAFSPGRAPMGADHRKKSIFAYFMHSVSTIPSILRGYCELYGHRHTRGKKGITESQAKSRYLCLCGGVCRGTQLWTYALIINIFGDGNLWRYMVRNKKYVQELLAHKSVNYKGIPEGHHYFPWSGDVVSRDEEGVLENDLLKSTGVFFLKRTTFLMAYFVFGDAVWSKCVCFFYVRTCR